MWQFKVLYKFFVLLLLLKILIKMYHQWRIQDLEKGGGRPPPGNFVKLYLQIRHLKHFNAQKAQLRTI